MNTRTSLYQSTHMEFFWPNEDSSIYSRTVLDKFGVVCAHVSARKLAWDTEALGVNCARIDALWMRDGAHSALKEAFAYSLEMMDKDKIEFCDIRIGLHEFGMINIAESLGFRLMDVLNIYLSKRSPLDVYNQNSSYKIITPKFISIDDYEQIDQISKNLFIFSRLYNDVKIKKKTADDFYSSLVQYFLEKKSSVINIALDQNKCVVGFAIGHDDGEDLNSESLGYLWVIGVSPKHMHRGIGFLLCNHFLQEYHKKCATIEVGTQVNNFAANSIYLKAGLSVVANVAALHRWRI